MERCSDRCLSPLVSSSAVYVESGKRYSGRTNADSRPSSISTRTDLRRT